MTDWPGNAGAPMGQIGAENLGGPVGIGQLEHSAEGTLLAQHAFTAGRSHNLVGPPTGCHLHGKLVLGIGTTLKKGGHIICKGAAGLLDMGKTGLQHFVTNPLTIHKQVIDTKGGGHPLGRNNSFLIFHGRDKPTGTIGGAAVLAVIYFVGYDGCVCRRNPLRLIPQSGTQWICQRGLRFQLDAGRGQNG